MVLDLMMRTASFFVMLVVGLVLLMAATVVIFTLLSSNPMENTGSQTKKEATVFAAEIEAVLARKIALVELLAANSELIEALVIANANDSQLSSVEIEKLDSDWKSAKGNSAFTQKFIDTPTAFILKKFQEENRGFVEIFVTDVVGLNVAQTNRTSDYLQSDEAWWVESYANGAGKASHGDIEFDDSAGSRSISLFVPIYDQSRNVIGVIKAVLDISVIQEEL